MQKFLIIFLSLCSTSAFARGFHCERKISPTRIEGGTVAIEPNFLVWTWFSEENPQGGHGGSIDTIANDGEVCFQEVNVQSDCQMTETATSFGVMCKNGIAMDFSMGTQSSGIITCTVNGSHSQVWNLGKCKLIR